MDDKSRRLLRVFEQLTPAQKRELAETMKDYGTKGILAEDVRKEVGMVMGPLGGSCPYCGK